MQEKLTKHALLHLKRTHEAQVNLLQKICHQGIRITTRKAFTMLNYNIKRACTQWRVRNDQIYANPTPNELATIEQDLISLNVKINSYAPSPELFKVFQTQKWFPTDYHGGLKSGVWEEKLLEHWIASQMLDLMNFGRTDIYVDIAAAGSPWAKNLRERKGIEAYAIDLCETGESYRHIPYYRVEEATQTTFKDASVTAASLHCAFEMFMKDDDTLLIHEIARILKPGGKVVILPLYLHTHYCAYSTSEYYGKGYSDPAAKEYVRLDCSGVPSSRKYDAKTLKKRVLSPIEAVGMHYRLHALRNKTEFGSNIYCHFILEIEK